MCERLTDLGPLWIVFLGVIQEGRHVVVQIGLETVDQVPEAKYKTSNLRRQERSQILVFKSSLLNMNVSIDSCHKNELV